MRFSQRPPTAFRRSPQPLFGRKAVTHNSGIFQARARGRSFPAPQLRVMNYRRPDDRDLVPLRHHGGGVAGRRRCCWPVNCAPAFNRIWKSGGCLCSGRVLPFDLVCTQAYAALVAKARGAGLAFATADTYITAIAAANGSLSRPETPARSKRGASPSSTHGLRFKHARAHVKFAPYFYRR
jgi:hypothetical protein